MRYTKCETCEHWKVLNPHHIENGQPVKSCDYGSVSDNCKVVVGREERIAKLNEIIAEARKLCKQSEENRVIAGNIRDYWMCRADGAE